MATGQPSPEAQFRMLRILHAALTASIFLYGLIVYLVVVKGPAQESPEQAQLILVALAAGAVSVTAMIPFLRKQLLAKAKNAQSLFVVSILSWALSESIAVFGLVASFVTRWTWPFFVFALVALINIMIYRPRRE